MQNKSAGFTLIEIVLVMAISGMLFVIAFAGQRQLRDQARFNESVTNIIQQISYARNYSGSHVNEVGGGNSTVGVIAGTGYELDNTHAPARPLGEIEPIYARQDANGFVDLSTLSDTWPPMSAVSDPAVCPPALHPDDADECTEDFLPIGDTDLRVLKVNGAARQNVVVYMVDTEFGLRVCHDTGTPFWRVPYQSCATFDTSPINIEVGDSEGFTATIQINPNTGEGKRL